MCRISTGRPRNDAASWFLLAFKNPKNERARRRRGRGFGSFFFLCLRHFSTFTAFLFRSCLRIFPVPHGVGLSHQKQAQQQTAQHTTQRYKKPSFRIFKGVAIHFLGFKSAIAKNMMKEIVCGGWLTEQITSAMR
jgi:hypothetical protein